MSTPIRGEYTDMSTPIQGEYTEVSTYSPGEYTQVRTLIRTDRSFSLRNTFRSPQQQLNNFVDREYGNKRNKKNQPAHKQPNEYQKMANGIYESLRSIDIPEIFRVNKAWFESTHPDKVNLGIGVYRDNEGLPWSLPVVLEAERLLIQDPTINFNYLPLSGMKDFRTAALRLLLGEDHKVIREKRVEIYQTIGGVGAIHLAATFLKNSLGLDTAYVASPTWDNGTLVIKASGFSNVKKYRYWNAKTKSLDFAGMIEDLQVVLFFCYLYEPYRDNYIFDPVA
ncbi:aspartate aminotransferase [Elysia marginata]|uniref:aspartate transaminase n=1 Tax=Elysia marginata TaxID=1093978 RepID=A0AAV4JUH2_9GAST|nr:aspartate aminotransferase [Elysia marginata]